jgi:hypothetical protein
MVAPSGIDGRRLVAEKSALGCVKRGSLLVRLSRWIDPVLGYRLGKSILGVWRKP